MRSLSHTPVVFLCNDFCHSEVYVELFIARQTLSRTFLRISVLAGACLDCADYRSADSVSQIQPIVVMFAILVQDVCFVIAHSCLPTLPLPFEVSVLCFRKERTASALFSCFFFFRRSRYSLRARVGQENCSTGRAPQGQGCRYMSLGISQLLRYRRGWRH